MLEQEVVDTSTPAVLKAGLYKTLSNLIQWEVSLSIAVMAVTRCSLTLY